MFDVPFRHATIKNTILAFGALFSKIKIIRPDLVSGNDQTIHVPITYGPKEKIFVRVAQDANFNNQVSLTLPRLAFEITSINFDGSRSVNKNQKILCHKPDGTLTGVFAPVPYNINITLYAITKGTEDGLDIIEQILPTFMPEYTVSVKTIQNMNLTQDIPFVLNSVSISDDYEGDFSTKRLVTTTFDFTAKLNLYGRPGEAKYITRTETSINNIEGTEVFDSHVAVGDPLTGEVVQDFWS